MRTLRAELFKRNISVSKLLELGKADGRLNCNLSTLYAKLRGEYEFTVDEATCIYEILKTDIPFMELFKKEV